MARGKDGVVFRRIRGRVVPMRKRGFNERAGAGVKYGALAAAGLSTATHRKWLKGPEGQEVAKYARKKFVRSGLPLQHFKGLKTFAHVGAFTTRVGMRTITGAGIGGVALGVFGSRKTRKK